MVAGRIRGHGEPAGHSLSGRFRKMPPFRGSVNDIAHRRHKGIEPFDSIRLLAAHNDPDLGEIRMVVSEITRRMFYIRGISTDDVGMGAVLSNGEIAPRPASGMLFLQC